MARRSLWRALKETERWSDRRSMLLSTFWWQPTMRAENRIRDAYAVAVGACNASTWTGEFPNGTAGGYSHWRCMKRRGHLQPRGTGIPGIWEPHRFHNYTWAPGEPTVFSPLAVGEDHGLDVPFRKVTAKRRAIWSRGRTREIARMQAIETARRQAERMGS